MFTNLHFEKSVNSTKYIKIYLHKLLIKTDLRLLNGEAGSIYLKVSDFKKLCQKIYHHRGIFHFWNLQQSKEDKFLSISIFKNTCAYLNKRIENETVKTYANFYDFVKIIKVYLKKSDSWVKNVENLFTKAIKIIFVLMCRC